MKEFKGTKGKWEVETFDYIKGEIFIMCKDSPLLRIAINNYADEEEAEANAKLTASAPELLEALQDLVIFCEDNEVGAELELAKEAINKAL